MIAILAITQNWPKEIQKHTRTVAVAVGVCLSVFSCPCCCWHCCCCCFPFQPPLCLACLLCFLPSSLYIPSSPLLPCFDCQCLFSVSLCLSLCDCVFLCVCFLVSLFFVNWSWTGEFWVVRSKAWFVCVQMWVENQHLGCRHLVQRIKLLGDIWSLRLLLLLLLLFVSLLPWCISVVSTFFTSLALVLSTSTSCCCLLCCCCCFSCWVELPYLLPVSSSSSSYHLSFGFPFSDLVNWVCLFSWFRWVFLRKRH